MRNLYAIAAAVLNTTLHDYASQVFTFNSNTGTST